MLVDYPQEWRKYMIDGETRKFSKDTPEDIIKQAKKLNERIVKYSDKPFFFFED